MTMAATLRRAACRFSTRSQRLRADIVPSLRHPQKSPRFAAQNRCEAVLCRHASAPTVQPMLAHVTTFTIDGLASRRITVEVDLRRGLPAFTIVGRGDAAVRESRERVQTALVNAGFEFPQRRITVNLAPAHLRKVGPGLRSGDGLRRPRRLRAAAGDRARALGGVRRAGARRRAAPLPRRAQRRGGSPRRRHRRAHRAARVRARGRARRRARGGRRGASARGRGDPARRAGARASAAGRRAADRAAASPIWPTFAVTRRRSAR